jgi:hypothetical protein
MLGANAAALPTTYATVVEIGPGESLLAGLTAILCGAEHYYAWDVIKYTQIDANMAGFEQLVELFEQRAELPEGEFSRAMFPREFPSTVLTDARLEATLAPERLDAIRGALRSPGIECDGIKIEYRESLGQLDRPADIVFSQAVMEHVDDYQSEYAAMFNALAGGGVTSHEIDFSSHHFARDWNGHWSFADTEWRIVRGRRGWAINRAPLSWHVAAIEAAGFEIARIQRRVSPSRLERSHLHASFASMPVDDLTTVSALIHAVRR